MLEAYVGEAAFRQGVRDYLNAHLYGNAQTENLWRAVQAASGQPILDIARSFTGQPGFPILAAESPDCVRTRGANIRLTQQRFAMDEASHGRAGKSRSCGAAMKRCACPAAKLRRTCKTACLPYLVNATNWVFPRFTMRRISTGCATPSKRSTPPINRACCLITGRRRSGAASFTNYLDLVAQLPADANPALVNDTIASLTALASYAAGRPSEAMVNAYALRTIAPFFAQLGWEARAGEHPNAPLTRARLISALGGLGDAAVVAEVRRRVAGNDIPAPLRDAVMGVYAANVTPAEYEALVAEARAAGDFVEQRRAWRRVAAARDPALAQRTLQLVLGEDIPRQIRTQVLSAVAGGHTQLAWDFLVANRAAIEALLDPLQRLEYPPGLASGSADPAMIPALEAYARDFPDGAGPTVAAAIAAIRIRAETVSQRMPAVEAWIAAREAPQRRRGAR